MAADQRKRRLSGPIASGCGNQDHYRLKKRDLRSSQHDLNFNSHISLKWDESKKKVIAKEDQIGISWRHLTSFVPYAPCSNTKLADVLSVPRDAFELDNLADILSFEVWQSLLTEKERNYLSQFLPRGHEPDQAVRALLAGDDFYFGNPFLLWGASLCSGDLHPDAIIYQEKVFKTNKKAYYSELQQYHDNMIRNLQKLKAKCANSKDPEAQIMQMTSRSKRYAEKSIVPEANEFKSSKPEENVAVVPESLSSVVDENLYYSDKQKLSAIRDAEILKRIHNQDLVKGKLEKSVASPNGLQVLPRPKKAEKLQKANVNSNDGAKYMSYVKISKKQHELLSMKQSGTSIQSETLNHVLGNLDSFNVKPYEMFVEEEQKRIHDYWSNLVNKDLPAALHNWRNRQSERHQIMSSLRQEMEEKLRFMMKNEELVNPHYKEASEAQDMDGNSSPETSEPHQDDDSAATQGSISDDDRECDPSFIQNESLIQNPLISNEELDPSSIENQSSAQGSPLSSNEEFDQAFIENQSSSQNAPLNINEEFNRMDLNAENHNITCEKTDTCLTMPEEHSVPQTYEASLTMSHPKSHSPANPVNADDMPCSSVKNAWPSITLPESYSHTPVSQYTSSSELSLIQPARLIDLESNLPEEDTTKDLLNRHTDQIPFFNPYPCRDRNELLHSLIRGNYDQEPKKTGLEFHPTTNILLDPSQFPSQFREQLQPSFADHRIKAQNELFMNQNIQDSVYSDNNRYSIQGQEHFPTLISRNWSSARISTPIQSSQLSSGELLSQTWFGNENRAHHGGWSGSDGTVFPSPSLGSGSSGDQSLYSVLSQCNTLHSRAVYNPVGPSEQIIRPPNYGQDMTGSISMPSNASPQTASPFDYLGGNEAPATLKNTNMGWMGLGHQTPSLHDPSGKPFLKSWHQ